MEEWLPLRAQHEVAAILPCTMTIFACSGLELFSLGLLSHRVCAGRLQQEHVRMKVRRKKSSPVVRRQRLEQRAESKFPGPFLYALVKEGLSEIRGEVPELLLLLR